MYYDSSCSTVRRADLNLLQKPMTDFNVITFIASLLRGTTQGKMTSQRERTVGEMTQAQPWLPSPTADPHSRDCYNTQSRLPVNDNDVITLGATIGTFEAVVFVVEFQ